MVSSDLNERIEAVQAVLTESVRQLAAVRATLRDTQEQLATGRTRRQRLRESAFARMEAQLDTMPVIEQAKGVLIAQTGCDPDAAFDMLRKASQRSNVRVSELAAVIVQRAVTGHPAAPPPAPVSPPGPAPVSAPARVARRPSPG